MCVCLYMCLWVAVRLALSVIDLVDVRRLCVCGCIF